MRTYNLVAGHQRFGGSCCLHLGDKKGPASEGCMFPRKFGSYLPGYTVSQLKGYNLNLHHRECLNLIKFIVNNLTEILLRNYNAVIYYVSSDDNTDN
jgi:hypothetical protein